MDRVRVLPVLVSFLGLFACDAPPPDPVAVEPGPSRFSDLGGQLDPNPLEFPFMPYPDGYQFKNFSGAADWTLFSEVFGGQVSFWSILDRDYYINEFFPVYGGGQCYGFALTAAMFDRGVFGPHPSFFQRGASETFQLVRSTTGGGANDLDEELERHISKYFFFQSDPEILTHFHVAETPEESWRVIDPMVEAQVGGWEDLWVLCAFGPHFGHCVNLIGVLRTDLGGLFWMYNNNAPFREDTNNPGYRTLQFTPDQFIFGDGTPDVNLVSVGPVSVQEKDHLNKWWGSMDQEEFWTWVSRPMDPDMFVIHIDDLGNLLGRTASAEFDDIPDALRVRIATGNLNEDWVEPLQYYLPPGDYTMELTNPTTGGLDYHLLAGDALFSLASPGSGSSAARVTSLRETRTFVVEPQTPMEGLDLKVARALSEEEERAVEISGLALPAEALIRIAPIEDADIFRVEVEGFEGVLANLTLTEASPAGILSVALPDVEFLSGAPVRVKPWDWSRLSQMPVLLEAPRPDGSVFSQAHNVTPATLSGFLDDLVVSGALPNQGVAMSIRRQVELAPQGALLAHLESLVTEGQISQETSDLILIVAEGFTG